MNKVEVQKKTILSVDILRQAYMHPNASQTHFANYPTNCPWCGSEFVFRHRERKLVICNSCGKLTKEREVNAA